MTTRFRVGQRWIPVDRIRERDGLGRTMIRPRWMLGGYDVVAVGRSYVELAISGLPIDDPDRRVVLACSADFGRFFDDCEPEMPPC